MKTETKILLGSIQLATLSSLVAACSMLLFNTMNSDSIKELKNNITIIEVENENKKRNVA